MEIVSCAKKSKEDKFDWSELELSDRLPKPASKKGTVYTDSEEELSIDVDNISKKEYKSYLKECQSMGYTEESEKGDDEYQAFDKDGYKLKLSYEDYGEKMDIRLTAPVEMGTLSWPNNELAKLLPTPKSTVGKVKWDTTDKCQISVGETSKEDYSAYVDACIEKGFAVDYNRTETSYHAKDASGNELYVIFEGNKVMSINISKAAEESSGTGSTDTTGTTDTGDSADSTSSGTTDGIRPEFKQAVDSYETSMNEYCDLMSKVAASDGTDLTLVKEVAEWEQKLSQVEADFDKLDGTETSDAEVNYYVEVQTRVNQKLLSVGQ